MRREALRKIQRVLLTVMVIFALAIAYLALRGFGKPQEVPAATPPHASPTPTEFPPKKVGIVAGHWGSDSGAVCPDGLMEVEINLEVARRVATLLRQLGYEVEVLQEFSPKLEGYQADALVSIHADSCNISEASGFKVARVMGSAIPQEEDRLLECLQKEYARTTGLHYREHSITYDMRDYHAFLEIDPQTPGAIIETGFMSGDRELLTKHPDVVARGIAAGIIRFLEGSQPLR